MLHLYLRLLSLVCGGGDGDGGVSSAVIFEKILDKVVIASICLSHILENGALGAGFLIALASANAAMVAFSADDL